MNADLSVIQKIEDLSLNAWPSYRLQFYDGWVLRYSAFYTHRTNCVEQIAAPSLPYIDKIEYCEDIYRKWHTPCIFKQSPLTDPLLTQMLSERGYITEHSTEVMTMSLDSFSKEDLPPGTMPEGEIPGGVSVLPLPAFPGYTIRIAPRTDTLWLDSFFDLKGNISAKHIRIVPQMYAAVPKDEIAILLLKDGKVCGTGLGILDRDAIGVYAVHIAPGERRKGLAGLIVRTILTFGKDEGASSAYLQAVSENMAARLLYEKIGFENTYSSSFLVKRDL